MKKIIVAVVFILGLLITGIYFFVPSQVRIYKNISINQNASAVSRAFAEKDKWKKWWQQNEIKYHPENFTLQAQSVNRYKISLHPAIKPTVIHVMDLVSDSSQIMIEAEFPGTDNFIQRVKNFFRGNKIDDALTAQLLSLKQFAEKDENIYGMAIHAVKVKDSILLSTRRQFDKEPTQKEIYDMIFSLKNYISRQGAITTNHPMLHSESGNGTYEVMVAIPVNKMIPETGAFKIKRMVPGSLLEAEVRGGPHTIKKSLREMENYMADHNKVSPAIPFELLVTNRLQHDTAQWITRLYYPIL